RIKGFPEAHEALNAWYASFYYLADGISSKLDNGPMNNIFCKGSVNTTILGVDIMVQNKGRNVKKSPSQVDTSPEKVDTGSSQVDTRDLSQGIVLPVWDSVSTHLLGRSTHSGISVT
ncbi:hypothetical protein Taro_019644, partial [Colocasia esculenta]|nr:hypothetical protein [Colocasia esculenta]